MTRSKLTGTDIMAWGKRASELRRELAEQLGVFFKTIESWEYETRTPAGPALGLLEQVMSGTTKKRNEK